ncbi:putative polyadenylation protein [Lachancea thermotolerans CBS 6340]|uniref:KLTH0D17402p n=1 Tax=Lachancea thermotolerans (strain ATCC 56472 / CBS 6340 / NRRL Y-8284) TaxID=559295 RepID=C5DFR9_LACTC|nr:KLTH0D17402p [Lachancea thermotolerans CBS 6340]CAR23024.1 KLTH0D17402p [Lachancea thermotolerans CBS 6340]
MKFLAEYLPRIRTVVITIESPKEVHVKGLEPESVELANDQGARYVIELPHRVVIDSSQNSFQSYKDYKTLRLRAVEDKGDRDLYKNRSLNFMMQVVPQRWMKRDLLGEEFQLRCKDCESCVLAKKDCVQINEMPSEFWAELMDYWHCHKPASSDGMRVDRYAKLSPLPGELLVGNSFFLISSSWPGNQLSFEGDNTACSKCSSVLGCLSTDNLYKINKWNLGLVRNGRKEVYPPEHFVISALLDLLNADGARKIKLKCQDSSQHLLLWIFAVGLQVTLPLGNRVSNCMKVYYKEEKVDESAINASKVQNIEELAVPAIAFSSFIEKLKTAHQQLPAVVKKMDNWSLGFVEYS